MQPLQLLIDGQWKNASNGQTLAIVNPATEEIVGKFCVAQDDDLDAAAEAAARGFAIWSRVSALGRGNLLRKCAQLMRERATPIAEAITRENGKTLKEAISEVNWASDYFDWFAEEARRSYGRVIPARMEGVRQLVVREPVGPVLALSPWNWPLMTATRKVAAALAAGCSVVLKPAEETPTAPAMLARILQECGLPNGVLNVVYGKPAQISSRLIAAPQIRKISFTGSVPVGRQLASLAALAGPKRMTLELGGHAPVIVFDDADIESTIAKLMPVKFRTSGQVCSCPSRFFVQEGVYEKFVSLMAQASAKLKVGNGMESDVDMGPLTSKRRLQAVSAFVENAVKGGAKVVTGGHRIGTRGHFHAPTVLRDVPHDAALMREETFGPLVPVVAFRTAEEAVKMANGVDVGLSAYIFTNSLATAQRMEEEVQAGMVGVNTLGVSMAEAPFGGIRDSGYGQEGGIEGLDAYLNTKFIAQAR
ncbi:MAG: NAD-dependent succinate-semialdehyde dehydrogenase [Betaproteobacteria bacterium]|nr:NAD-dependent succinate-semialdehyde dehydrogenase [Betaproteobacteria bacterium]